MTKIRQRTKNLIYAGLVGVVVTSIFSVSLGIYSFTKWSEEKGEIQADYEQRLKEAEKFKLEQMKDRKKVLLSKQDIKAGETLTTDQFMSVELLADQVPVNIIVDPEQLEGKITKIDISKNGTVIPSMLFKDGILPKDLRKTEYKEIILPSKLVKDEYVDIRINFPTGQDYIIVGKKKVDDINNGTVWFDISEQEILSMSSAIVDAYINDAKIYALSYVDPYMQDAPKVNYPVNQKVLDLILTDPNVLRDAKAILSKNARKALDNDLDTMTAEEKQKVSNNRSAATQQNTTTNSQIDSYPKTAESIYPTDVSVTGDAVTPSSSDIQQSTDTNISSVDSSSSISQKEDNTKPITKNEAQNKELDIYKESVGSSVQP